MLTLDIRTERWSLKEPFRITNFVFTEQETLLVSLRDGAHVGQGEASGVYYKGETSQSMIAQLEAVRASVEQGIDRNALRNLLPPGGARNALDCALWDLEAKRASAPARQLAGIATPAPITTTFTIGAGTPHEMAEKARSYKGARALKLKLTGDDGAESVRAVREARPDVWIGVDANQALTRSSLKKLLPQLRACDVGLIEQPVPIGRDRELEGLKSPIPIAADESVQCVADIPSLIGRYDAVNIKLDKCGGLTEGLMMAEVARRLGFKVMVGCMAGTSLAMAPAFLLGQLCDFVDLDAPVFLAADRTPGAVYDNGEIWCPESVWGAPSDRVAS